MPSQASLVPLFLYFRIIVDGALRSPIGWAGVIALAVHRSWVASAICLASLIAAHTFANGLLFWRGAGDKRKVEEFLEQHKDATFIRITSSEFALHFDFSFLIPSYIRPQRFIDYFVRNRLHVFILKRGKTSPPASACAFVSPIAQDAFVFLRDSLDRLTDGVRYRITHELGHAAGIFQNVAQRNAIGLSPVYISVLWVLATFPWTPLVLFWSLAELAIAFLYIRPIFIGWKRREHLNAELVADYMALRHLPDAVIHGLVDSGKADRLIPSDEGLTASENEERRAIFASQIAKLHAGEPIDIPEVYMRETFSHPLGLIAFAFLHFAYIGTMPIKYMPALWGPIGFAVLGLLFYVVSARIDAEYRIGIKRTLESRTATATEATPAAATSG